MKVAFATTDGAHVDEHFGRAGKFTLYEFTPQGYQNLGVRVFAEGRDGTVEGTKGQGAPHDEAVNEKMERLSDCSIVYLTNIGGPSAARLVSRGIMPVKVKEGVGIEESARRLMETIRTAPPPWLKKLIGIQPSGPSVSKTRKNPNGCERLRRLIQISGGSITEENEGQGGLRGC